MYNIIRDGYNFPNLYNTKKGEVIIMKKIISLILVIAATLSVLALISCVEDIEGMEGTKETDVTEATTTPMPPLHLGEYPTCGSSNKPDFQGHTVTFAVCDPESEDTTLSKLSCLADEKTGDAIVDAIYERNQLIKEALNVNIEISVYSFGGPLIKNVIPSLLANANDFDVVWGAQVNELPLSLEGFMLDLSDPEQIGSYINYENEWWDSDYIESINYQDHIHWLSGPISLSYLGGAACVLVNQRLYNESLAANYGNIYDYVLSGKWTLDDMAAMCNAIHRDMDADDRISQGDVIGSAFSSSWSIMQLLVGVGMEGSIVNADGSQTLGINTKNNEYINTVHKTYSTLEACEGVDHSTAWKDYFISGNQLFRFCSLQTLNSSDLREMADDFYVIPAPKLDSSQSEYRSAMTDANHVIGISYTCENVPAASAVLEMMAYHNHRTVSSVFNDELVKYIPSGGNDIYNMIGVIRDSVYTDFVLAWEKKIFGSHWIRYNGFQKNIKGLLAKNEGQFTSKFNEIIAKLEAQ